MPTLQTLPESVIESRAYQILERSMEQGRLSHAILLHGENLKTLELVARHFAGRLLSSEQPFEHPDCFTCRPRGKARIIGIGTASERQDGKYPVGTMRRLVKDMAMTSHQGGNKVGVIYEADRMNPAASNAFLKTLEEPPDGATLFLLTTSPYYLLDTIRSRCLNFRVPASFEIVDHPDWVKWTTDYREWLGRLLEGPNKKTVPHIMMGAYGLNERFRNISKDLVNEEWKRIKPTLPESITDKEIDAMETGVTKTFRRQLFGEIEKATAQFARDIEALNTGELPASALHRATEALEKAAGLMEINFNQVAALELFFLSSLRIWTTAR